MITYSSVEVRGKYHSLVVVDGERIVGRKAYRNEHIAGIEAYYRAQRIEREKSKNPFLGIEEVKEAAQ